jgi:hypothetical protein
MNMALSPDDSKEQEKRSVERGGSADLFGEGALSPNS